MQIGDCVTEEVITHKSEVAQEQTYFNHALDRREASRSAIVGARRESAVQAHADGFSVVIRRSINVDLAELGTLLAFGRFDLEPAEVCYLGLNTICGEDENEILVEALCRPPR